MDKPSIGNRAALYCRVSTDDQRKKGYSLPQQVRECVRYAEEHGYLIVGNSPPPPDIATGLPAEVRNKPVFIDDYTGTKSQRPGMDELKQFLLESGFDVLVCLCQDRLGRGYALPELKVWFRHKAVRLEYASGNYTDDLAGKAHETTDEFITSIENLLRADRSTTKKREKAEHGLFVGGGFRPYGYRLDKSIEPGGLAVVEAEQRIVTRIFKMFVDGKSVRAIARTLTADGIKPPKGNGNGWGKSTITRILNNELYAGQTHYNKFRRLGDRLELRPAEDWIPISVTPIIDKTLFNAAQVKLADNRQHVRTRRVYLLSGMVRCAECGKSFYTQTGKAGINRRANDAPVYRHRMSHGHCRNQSLSANILERQVWSFITDILLDPDKLRQGYATSLERQSEKRNDLLEVVKHMEEELSKSERKLDNLTQRWIDPDIGMSKAEYIRNRAPLEARIGQLQSQINTVVAELDLLSTPADLESLDQFAAVIREYLEGDTEPPSEEKRKILELLHVQVIVDANSKVRIEGWFDQPSETEGMSALTS